MLLVRKCYRGREIGQSIDCFPDCIKAWTKGKKAIIRNPNSTRPWQHVLDVLNGYIVLASQLRLNRKLHGEVFNFGPTISKNLRVVDILKLVKKFGLKFDGV